VQAVAWAWVYQVCGCDYRWERNPETASAGYGITSVLEGGTVLEKAAANISVINGTLSPERARAMSERGRSGINKEGGDPYSAVAMSLVFHSAHPFIPTLRADVRMFKVGGFSIPPSIPVHRVKVEILRTLSVVWP
jgi:coproporphyrinogen III oxidase